MNEPTPGRQAVVLYDGQCPLCLKSVALLRRLDWFRRLTYADARTATGLNVPLDAARLLQEMHVITPAQRVYHGYRAVRWLAWRLPLLWPLAPLLYLPGAETLGQRLYLWVARNRFHLVPCHDGVCRLPGA